MRDFTLHTYYRLLLALQKAGYQFYTLENYYQQSANGFGQTRFVLLRHDVDLHAERSLATARIEAELGIRASYYFRVVPQSNQPAIIKAIADLGHEIGYHYEDMAICGGDVVKAKQHFETQLAYFRNYYPVKTICMHGAPQSQFDGKELWKTCDYRTYGIIGEPYFEAETLDKCGDKRSVTVTGTVISREYKIYSGVRTLLIYVKTDSICNSLKQSDNLLLSCRSRRFHRD